LDSGGLFLRISALAILKRAWKLLRHPVSQVETLTSSNFGAKPSKVMLIKMRLSTSALFILASFTLGYFARSKVAPRPIEQMTFVSKTPGKPSPKSEVVAGRAPQSATVTPETGLVKPARETINGIDIVQAMLNKDMAKVYAANRAFEQAWRHQFIESHVHKLELFEQQKWDSLVRSLPVQKEDDEQVFRGRTTLNIDGKAVYIDAVMSISLLKLSASSSGEEKTEVSHPCFRLDGFISVDKTVERLDFDQAQGCNMRLYERSGATFIGIDNYRRASGSVINMLLIPVNPAERLALEYLTGNTADWKKDANWSWQAADPGSWEALTNLMTAQAQAAGIDPDSLGTSLPE
jgi:hypothetical protein